MKPKSYVTCGICGWVMYPISRAYAEQSVALANQRNDAISRCGDDDFRPFYFQREDISRYEKCFRCGAPFTEMVKSKPEDCPVGVTLQPIIWEAV